MNYPLGVEKFIEVFATENGLTMEEVVEDVVIDWFARIMLKMSLFGLKITQVSPFLWNKETGDRFRGKCCSRFCIEGIKMRSWQMDRIGGGILNTLNDPRQIIRR